MNMQSLYLLVPLAPLLGAIIAGLFGQRLGRTWSHRITIALVAVSFLASLEIFEDVQAGHLFNGAVYTWLISGETSFHVGFLIDRLTVLMMLVVTFVSLMVHIYTIGYMKDDAGYQRFFSYISLFTFSMLMLVMANNFMQLFFGWEAVGLVSYLLIGFWYDRPTAIYASLKAFLVESGWRPGFPARHCAGADGVRHAGLCRGVRQCRAACRRIWRPFPACRCICCPRSASCCSSARWASRRSSRCMSGCPIRWKARPRSRH